MQALFHDGVPYGVARVTTAGGNVYEGEITDRKNEFDFSAYFRRIF